MLEAEAKERQRAAGVYGVEGGRGHKKEETLSAELDEGFVVVTKKAAQQAAELVGASATRIYEMKKIAREAPERVDISNIPFFIYSSFYM